MQLANLFLTSQQTAMQQAMDVVANNIANANTTGFKSETISFDSYMQPGSSTKANFAVPRSTRRDVAEGPIQTTGNPLDLAIHGDAYFQVQGADGNKLYTRAGTFLINSQGQISTYGGQPVLSDGGQPITVPDTSTDINISGDGYITVKTDNGTSLTELGKIGLVKFDNDQLLKSQGGSLYSTDQTAAKATDASVVQGSIEQSNVNSIQEMTHMMQIMRSYEQASNMMGQENSRLDDAINKLSKTTA